ncbi:MAG: glycosyltransferase [Pseudomonadota bacterium]
MATATLQSPMTSLAVCICTYKRNQLLAQLLTALDEQAFVAVPTPDILVVVTDNSPDAGAREAVTQHGGRWTLSYVHEPRPGISHARNACIKAIPAGTQFIAMIDDDEEPSRHWLEQLLSVQAKSDADIVVGPTVPKFPQGTPEWIAATGFFLKPQNQRELDEFHPDPPTATCNVLLRHSLLAGSTRPFDPSMSLSGGEDRLFFQDLKMKGASFAWASSALVTEHFSPGRATLRYMLREAYRRGCVTYPIKRALKARSSLHTIKIAVRITVRYSWRFVTHLPLLLFKLGADRTAWVPVAVNMAESLGTIAGVFQIPNRHYGDGNTL